ncbi:hypothetical protein YTPLAS18_38090 [Nitrospira sp.]|nr:hypothetical protein YTPLAS18_38090 [Nitrospira sp.]
MKAIVETIGTRRIPAAAFPCRVTVVIIFLNERQFLAEAIQSVLSQTFLAWELLLVDDGSTDGSTDVAKRHAVTYSATIRYLDHPGHANRGMSASRNLGLAHARGEFVLFLDADDTIVPTTLDDQVTFMDAHPGVGTVYGPMRLWRSWNGSSRGGHVDGTTDLHLETDRVHDPVSVLTTFLLHEDAVPSGNLIRTEMARRIGGFEDEFTGMYEDQVFRVKLCRVAPSYVSSRIWYHYRQHSRSCCATMITEGKISAARARFLRWVKAYCRRHNVTDSLVRGTINRALRPYHYPRIAQWQSWCAQARRRWAWRLTEQITNIARRWLPDRIWSFLRDRVKGSQPGSDGRSTGTAGGTLPGAASAAPLERATAHRAESKLIANEC